MPTVFFFFPFLTTFLPFTEWLERNNISYCRSQQSCFFTSHIHKKLIHCPLLSPRILVNPHQPTCSAKPHRHRYSLTRTSFYPAQTTPWSMPGLPRSVSDADRSLKYWSVGPKNITNNKHIGWGNRNAVWEKSLFFHVLHSLRLKLTHKESCNSDLLHTGPMGSPRLPGLLMTHLIQVSDIWIFCWLPCGTEIYTDVSSQMMMKI